MATVTSRLQPLTDYLVTLFTNAATLGAASPPVQILDGSAVTELDSGLKLYVGWTDPDNTGYQPGGDTQQTWGALGRLGRDEHVVIHCCAEAWLGTDDFKATRLACTGITAAVEVLMQTDTTGFGGNALFPDPGLTNQSMPQNATTTSGSVRQTFDLEFKCRIGGF